MKHQSLMSTMTALGLTIPRARDLANGATPANDAETLAAPALRHAYTGVRQVGTSIPAAYEAGMRLAARDRGAPVARATTSNVWSWEHGSVTLRRVPKMKNEWLLDGVRVNALGLHDALVPLVDHPTVPPAVHVATRRDLFTAKEAIEALPQVHVRVRALLAWWMEGIDHAGSGIAVDVDATVNSMFATERAETSVDSWAQDLGVTSVDPMVGLSALVSENSYAIPAFVKAARERWAKIRRKADDGWLRANESSADMAAALESMSAAADFQTARGLSSDSLLQEAALWSGHVVAGVWHSKTASTWTFAAGDAPCRYRAGSEVSVVLHDEGESYRVVNATVASLGYDAEAGVLVTIHVDGKPNNARELDRVFDPTLTDADRSAVLLRPRTPDAGRVAESWERARRMRAAADRRSWLRDESRKPKVRGQMPWDVYLAAAT